MKTVKDCEVMKNIIKSSSCVWGPTIFFTQHLKQRNVLGCLHDNDVIFSPSSLKP